MMSRRQPNLYCDACHVNLPLRQFSNRQRHKLPRRCKNCVEYNNKISQENIDPNINHNQIKKNIGKRKHVTEQQKLNKNGKKRWKKISKVQSKSIVVTKTRDVCDDQHKLDNEEKEIETKRSKPDSNTLVLALSSVFSQSDDKDIDVNDIMLIVVQYLTMTCSHCQDHVKIFEHEMDYDEMNWEYVNDKIGWVCGECASSNECGRCGRYSANLEISEVGLLCGSCYYRLVKVQSQSGMCYDSDDEWMNEYAIQMLECCGMEPEYFGFRRVW